ncbi:MAG: hypothetical protein HY852_16840 [Bradyrhizobium sp.]|uniref:hypothetical protein n=1 Tax=Bradyrhizobium sp. TaxID=376 RepID=UPI0025BD9387|nr:hypothetical protein [Bradyrhizobium sp.]MBI5263479.1 hypothetical protein [Bradyrhizobium sp.]
MTKPTAKEIRMMARVADLPVDDEAATRVANSICPAFDAFAPIAGSLPFDLEPAMYVLAQMTKVSK